MDFLLAYINQKMAEKGVKDYDVTVELITIAASSTETIPNDNDYRFLANAFMSGSDPMSGSIISDNAALNLTPLVLNTGYYKHINLYHGRVDVTNNSTTDTLYVEFLIVTPLISDNHVK